MTRVLIIEDEHLAAERLIRLLSELDPGIEVAGHLDSVRNAVNWFSNNQEPDLLFLDIKLSDGLSFEILDKIKIECPIIFTTAYDNYAIQAFKTNSVDYLLKPVSREELQGAYEKFKSRQVNLNIDRDALLQLLSPKKSYKERFIIKIGEHLKAVTTSETELFLSENKATYLYTFEGKKYLLDQTLGEVETLVDPEQFYRINRSSIINREGIKDIIVYTNSRLKVVLSHNEVGDLIVARDRVQDFRKWLE